MAEAGSDHGAILPVIAKPIGRSISIDAPVDRPHPSLQWRADPHPFAGRDLALSKAASTEVVDIQREAEAVIGAGG